jgi:hypothetical protein
MIRQLKAESREPISWRYNQRIHEMLARASSGPRIGSLHTYLLTLFRILAFFFATSALLSASTFGDAARQLAGRIASTSGPGAIAFTLTNRSSFDDKSVHEIQSALQAQLRLQGVRTTSTDQSMGSVEIVLSENLREYVWTALITMGTDAPRVVLVSVPRPVSGSSYASALPITLKKTLLFTQEEPILDAALIDSPMEGRTSSSVLTATGSLIVLDATRVAIYRQQSGHWEPETSLPIQHSRTFPRDTRGRLLLRRDHLFDVYLPGVVCHSSTAPPLTMNCAPSDDPWRLASEDPTGAVAPAPVRAFYAPARNFFTGVLSPGIGKVSNVPSFYSAAVLPRPNYTLWVFAAVDGSIHLVDGITGQAVRAGHAGSDLASVRSNCGTGTQLLVSENGDPSRDTLRAYEIPDRDPVAVSAPLDFDGAMTALWPDASGTSAIVVVKREDTGWYEANRISIACSN